MISILLRTYDFAVIFKQVINIHLNLLCGLMVLSGFMDNANKNSNIVSGIRIITEPIIQEIIKNWRQVLNHFFSGLLASHYV